MSGKKYFILAGICLLLLGIVVLNPFTQQTSPTGKEENNSENNNIESNNSESNNSESDNPNSYFINNWGNTSHEVTVELFNSKNASVFKESYTSVPGETIKGQLPITLIPEGEIIVTLDNNITKTQFVSEDLIGLVLYIDIDMITSDPLDLSIVLP